VNCLKWVGRNVFLPAEIQVWGGDDNAHLRLIGTLKTPEPKKNDSTLITGLVCKLTPGRPVSCIKLAVKPAKIPPWSRYKGKSGWVFADEVLLN